MGQFFVDLIVAAPVLAVAWMMWQIVFVEDREQRKHRMKYKGPIRILTEISPGLGEDFWKLRRKQ